jgi:hypothetical protein
MSSNPNPFDQFYAGRSFRGTLYGDDGVDTDVASVCTVDDDMSAFLQAAAAAIERNALETRSEQDEDVRQFNALTDTHHPHPHPHHDDSSGSGSSRNDHEDLGSILTEEFSSMMMDTMDCARYPPSSRATSPLCDDVMSLATLTTQQQKLQAQLHQQRDDVYLEAVSHARVLTEYTIEFYPEEDDVEQQQASKNAVAVVQPHATFIGATDDDDNKHNNGAGGDAGKSTSSSAFAPSQAWLSRKRRFLMVVFILAAAVGAVIGVVMLLQNNNAAAAKSSTSSTVDNDTANDAPPVGQYKVFQSRQELEDAVDYYLETIRDNGKADDDIENHVVAQKYGYPMGSWKWTTNVTNLSFLFAATRNPKAALFNEPLDHW